MPSFADRLGERLVAAQPSGALLESLYFHPELSSAPFFEPAVKSRLKRLSNFRHSSYARATRLHRDLGRGGRLALVSAYIPGRRLADVLVLARRGRVQPTTGAVLSLTRQLMTAVALLHDYAPDVFHGVLGLERLVVAPDGRMVITEYVLGAGVEQAVAEWGRARLWRDYRLAMLGDTSLSRYGRRVDLVQIGVVTLSLLMGRPLSAGDYADNLPDLLQAARETTADGESVAMSPALKDWLARMLCLDPASAFRTLVEAQKAFGRLVDEDARYAASASGAETFFQRCEDAALLPVAPSDSGAVAVAAASTFNAPAALPGATAAHTVTAAVVATESPAPVAAPVTEPGAALATTMHEALDAQPASQRETGSQDFDEKRAVEIPDAPEPPLPADPFTPWPVLVGSETVATLFETFKPQGERESHGAAVPNHGLPRPETAADALVAVCDTGSQGDAREPAPADLVASAPPAAFESGFATVEAADGMSGWTESAHAARVEELRQTLFATPAAPPAEETRESAGAAQPGSGNPADPGSAAPAAPDVAPAYEWASPPPARPGGQRDDAASSAEAAAAQATTPQPAPPGSGPVVVHERRVPVVRGYDEIHKPVPKRGRGTLVATAAVVMVLGVLAVLGGPRLWRVIRSGPSRPAAQSETAKAPAADAKPGGFRITTQPPGGRITIDGTPRGTAPLHLTDLAPGLHSITVESEWGSVDEAVTVEAGKIKPLTLATVGWLKLASPVELHVSEQGKSFGTTLHGPVMVPAGRHHFDLSNQAVAVRLRQFVDVPPGGVVNVPLELPAGVLNLVSDQPAQVLLDGAVVGDTPLLSVPAPLGSHEVIFRSDKYGDVSYTVNVTLAAPVRLTVNFAGSRSPVRR